MGTSLSWEGNVQEAGGDGGVGSVVSAAPHRGGGQHLPELRAGHNVIGTVLFLMGNIAAFKPCYAK